MTITTMHQGSSLKVRSVAAIAAAALLLAACAAMQRSDPLKVTVVDIASAPSEGLEARMQLKLRVQNPNAAPIEFSGIYVELDVLGKSFASGVSSESGTVPAFGEAVIGVPVTVSILALAGQAMEVLGGKHLDKLTYELRGKLNSSTSGTLRFKSQGELTLPTSVTPGDADTSME